MITGIRQKAIVGEGGRIEILSPDLIDGTLVDVIVLVEPVEQDATDYLLSTEANRRHLRQALRELDQTSNYIYQNVADL
jgi:antitoxin YefM